MTSEETGENITHLMQYEAQAFEVWGYYSHKQYEVAEFYIERRDGRNILIAQVIEPDENQKPYEKVI